jgi:hypothetical protein
VQKGIENYAHKLSAERDRNLHPRAQCRKGVKFTLTSARKKGKKIQKKEKNTTKRKKHTHKRRKKKKKKKRNRGRRIT